MNTPPKYINKGVFLLTASTMSILRQTDRRSEPVTMKKWDKTNKSSFHSDLKKVKEGKKLEEAARMLRTCSTKIMAPTYRDHYFGHEVVSCYFFALCSFVLFCDLVSFVGSGELVIGAIVWYGLVDRCLSGL